MAAKRLFLVVSHDLDNITETKTEVEADSFDVNDAGWVLFKVNGFVSLALGPGEHVSRVELVPVTGERPERSRT